MKRVNDETERSRRALGKACIGVVIGLSLVGVTQVNAQERDTARTNRAVLAPQSSNSDICAALQPYIAPYIAQELRTMARLDSVQMKIMPEIMKELMSSGQRNIEISSNAIRIPDSLRAPLIDAVTRGAFDSARAISQKFISADDKVTATQLAILLKTFEATPQDLRSRTAEMFLAPNESLPLPPSGPSSQSGTCPIPSPAASPPQSHP